LVGVGETRLGNVFGIVYRTDAKVSPDVKIVGAFPAYSHSPIVYPVAATVTAKPEAVGYLAFLCSMTAKVIFEQYGFQSLIQPTS
jgi:molybdate transport system substrate-binding protein